MQCEFIRYANHLVPIAKADMSRYAYLDEIHQFDVVFNILGTRLPNDDLALAVFPGTSSSNRRTLFPTTSETSSESKSSLMSPTLFAKWTCQVDDTRYS